ncbi:MAG: oligoendopeptidase F, partial [Chloroflexi bacterium]|nr:oligoendopeptidase F [Chloroflexota bacterium]
SLIGLPKLRIYDQYAPIGPAGEGEGVRYAYEQARDTILHALNGFAPRFATVAREFFEKNWIDAEIRPGKRGGAFCSYPTPTVHPYILCNYTDNVRDAMTVAHELGHGIHGYLARQQTLFNYHPSLPVCETASVFAEILVFDHLVKQQLDRATQLGLICQKIEDIFATVFRQNVLTRFEQKVFAARQAGRLTPERTGDLWIEANAPYYGPALEMTDGYRWGWSYIPHFINTRFYCYSYVFGELLVLALYAMYRDQGASFVPEYVRLLERGGSAAPEDLVKPLGVDIRDRGFWQKGFDELGRLVSWAKSLASGE